jgi:rubrerythrin
MWPKNLDQGNFAAGFSGEGVFHCQSKPRPKPVNSYQRRKLEMFSQIPVDLTKVKKEELNKVILRAAIIGELDAINLYQQMAALTDNEDIRKVMLDIAKEEKAHVGEFQTLLLRLDQEQVQELEQGRKEVEELTGKK